METGIAKKAIIAGAALFFLGGLSVYLLMADKPEASEPPEPPQNQQISNTNHTNKDDVPEMTHANFLAEAEARREQNLENKAELERLEKLKKAKLNSVECKFWKQQLKTSSAAAKIDEKINHFCHLPTSSSDSSSSIDA